MSCKYVYQGKKYTRVGLLKAIQSGEVEVGNQEKARQNLRQLLGMADSDIEIVQGLIDGNAVGRLLTDGRILLSTAFVDGDEYHEAFHRVFRMFTTPEQRAALIQEYRKREGVEQAIANKQKQYGGISEETAIEELLAEEFMMYQLSNGKYSVPKPVETLFDRIIRFLKKMLGIQDIEGLYRNIRSGKYAGAPILTYPESSADSKVALGSTYITIEEKNEIVESVIANAYQSIFQSRDLDTIFSNDGLTESIQKALETTIRELAAAGHRELAQAVLLDVMVKTGNIYTLREGSYILEQIRIRFEQMGFEMKMTTPTLDEVKWILGLEEEEDTGEDEETTNDHAFMKVSWEYDPKDNITRAVKFVVGTILDDNEKSEKLGLTKLVSYDKVIATLFRELSTVPLEWDAVVDRLLSKIEDYPWLNNVLERLLATEAVNVPGRIVRLRNQFMKSLIKTSYEMHTFKWDREGVLGIHAADDVTNEMTMLRDAKNHVAAEFDSVDQMKDALKNRSLTGAFQEAFGLEIEEGDLDAIIDGTSLRDRMQAIVNNATVILDNTSNRLDVFKTRVIVKEKNHSVVSNLRKVLRFLGKKQPPTQLMVFNHQNNRIYPFTTHTYQTQIANLLNWINEQVEVMDFSDVEQGVPMYKAKLQKRIEMLQDRAPQLVNSFNFVKNEDGELIPTSPMLLRILGNGERYVIGGNLGMTYREKSGVDAKKLESTDLLVQALRAVHPMTGMFLGIKHGDRGSLFTGRFSNRRVYVQMDSVERMREVMRQYLAQMLADEIRFALDSKKYKHIKNMGKGKLELFSFLGKQNLKDLSKLSVDELNSRFETELTEFTQKLLADTKELMMDAGLMNQDGSYKTAKINRKAEVATPIFMSVEDLPGNDPKKHKEIADRYIEYATYNYAVSFIEELRTFSGTISQFKNVAEFFKRVQSLSSSGTPLITDADTGKIITNLNSKPFKILNEKGKLEELPGYGNAALKEAGIITEKVTFGPRVTSNVKDELEKAFRAGLKSEGLSEATIEERVKEWISAYENYEEADGVADINIFFYREYKLRAGGEWDMMKENAFQIELAVMRTTNIASTVVYVNEENTVIQSVKPEGEGWRAVRIFDYNEDNAEIWRNVDALTMLKPIYSGPVNIDGTSVVGIRKTSLRPMIPSLVRNTLLEAKNRFSLRNGIDMLPLDSVAKTGVRAELSDMFEDNPSTDDISYLDAAYMKEQVPVSSQPKWRIKNATQSVKILLSNFYNEGYPKDVTDRVAFDLMDDAGKRKMSSVYGVVQNYIKTLSDILEQHRQDLIEELEAVETKDGLMFRNINRLINALKSRADAPHVLDAIDLLASTPYIDLLPNYRRLESILYSIVSRNVISIERPGDLKPQFSVTGMDTVYEKGKASSRLKFYSFEYDEQGNIKKVNPAQMIIPLPKHWIKAIVKLTGKHNIVEAIEAYKELPSNKKILVKSLRIPNQQLSFNGVYEIAEFGLPTAQSYVIMPSESVPQSSTDFDLDKQQIYFPVLDETGNWVSPEEDSEGALYNEFLQAEIDLLLHPSNAFHLIAPVNEGWLKDQLFEDIMVAAGKFTRAEFKKNRETITVPMDTPDFFSLGKQLRTGIAMVQSKLNVGKIATQITQHAIAAYDGWTASQSITTDTGNQISMQLPIQGQVDEFGNMFDNEERHIMESLSTFLTSQLDGIKDNYAVMMNITARTIPILVLGLRRKISPKVMLKLLMSEPVLKYIQYQEFADSITAQSRNLHTQRRKKGTRFAVKSTTKVDEYMNEMYAGERKISETDIDAVLEGKGDPDELLAAFRVIQEQADAMLEFTLYASPDTRRIRTHAALDNYRRTEKKLTTNRPVAKMPQGGFLKMFYKNQQMYDKVSEELFLLRKRKELKPIFEGVMDDFVSRIRSTDVKDKFRRIAESDLMSFLLVNHYKVKFDPLMKGEESLAKRINDIQHDSSHPLHENYLIQNMNVLFTVAKDPYTDEDVHILQLANRGATPLHWYDMYQAYQELPAEMQRDIIFVSIFQSGMDYSPFSLEEIQYAALKEEVLKVLQTMEITPALLDRFSKTLPYWNPSVLAYRVQEENRYSGLSFDAVHNAIAAKGESHIRPVLGNGYVKRYDLEGGTGIPASLKETKKGPEPGGYGEDFPTSERKTTRKRKEDTKDWTKQKNNCPKL